MEERLELFNKEIKKQITYQYLSLFPADYQQRIENKFPLLLYLHGAGERGNDLNLLRRNGIPKLTSEGAELPFVVIAPQCPENSRWDIDGLIALLDDAIDRHRIDNKRIYLTGLSMGGQAVWLMANAISERLAAVVPICGLYVKLDLEKFRSLPIWCFHGAMDEIVPLSHSLMMIRELEESGCSPKFTIYEHSGHDSWTETYENAKVFKWLLSQKLPG